MARAAITRSLIGLAIELGVRLRLLRTSGDLIVPGEGRTQLQ